MLQYKQYMNPDGTPGGWVEKTARVYDSFLATTVVVGANSRIERSSLHAGVIVGDHCVIEDAVVDRDVLVDDSCLIRGVYVEEETHVLEATHWDVNDLSLTE